MIDFYVFYSDVVVDTIDYFANIVKETTDRKKVVGAMYNYMQEFRGGPEFGHNAGGKIMRSKDIDFVIAPPSYHQRQLGSGAECYRRPFLPGTLHNKLWFHDNDLATFKFFEIMRRRNIPEETIAHYATQIYPTPTVLESIWLFQRSAGFVLCEGIYESFFDLHGGYFDDPRLLDALGVITKTLSRSTKYDRSSIAEILVLSDEPSLAYCTFQSDWPAKPYKNRINESLLDHQLGFIKSGAPFDSGLLSDIDIIDFSQYKLIVFLNTYNVNDADREIIAEKIKGNNRIVVFCYAPGYFNGNTESACGIEELTGIKVVPAQSQDFIEAKLKLTQAGADWMKKQGEEPLDSAFGMEGKIVRLFSVQDDKAETLAVLQNTETPTMAYKEMDGWTSVYTLSPVLPPALVRNLAKSAGVHIFSEGNDTLYINKSYTTINSGSVGEKTIRLPFKADVYNALTEKLWYKGVNKFSAPLMYGETQIYRYQPHVD